MTLDELLAKEAIRDVLLQYCRAMDRMDRELALSVWHDDGTCNYVDLFEGTAAGWVDRVWKIHSKLFRHSHQITNSLIEIDGHRAVSETYVTAVLWRPPVEAPLEITSRGRYLDRWSFRQGRWAIDHRLYLNDLTRSITIPAEGCALVVEPVRRDRRDPSYELFAELGRPFPGPAAGSENPGREQEGNR